MGVGAVWQVTGLPPGAQETSGLKNLYDGYVKKSHTCYVGNAHGFPSGLRYSFC